MSKTFPKELVEAVASDVVGLVGDATSPADAKAIRFVAAQIRGWAGGPIGIVRDAQEELRPTTTVDGKAAVFLMVRGPDGEPDALYGGRAIDVESVPRAGETVYCTGPQFGDTAHDDGTHFVVDEVFYQFGVGEDGAAHESEVPNVFLREEHASWRPKCTCSRREARDDDPTTCDSCNGRIP